MFKIIPLSVGRDVGYFNFLLSIFSTFSIVNPYCLYDKVDGYVKTNVMVLLEQ